MTPQERLLRDMARCPDLFGPARCRLMRCNADRLKAERTAAL